MSLRKKGRRRTRRRIGRVSLYVHHGNYWVYYRDQGKAIRRRVADSQGDAEQVAAQVNAQLVAGAPTLLAFTPITVAELRRQFLEYHEHVLRSSLATVTRYRAATQHLENFASKNASSGLAHETKGESFVAYVRPVEVAPNGHPHTARRRLRDKGIQFILETCRAMFTFASKRRHLPPYAGNPFADLPLDRLKIEDAKPIFVFDAATELAFLKAADRWAFPIHFTLANTGLRVGELVHLLIEDLDLEGGWLRVCNKTALGWRVKTGNERNVPLIAEVVAVLRYVIGSRTAGPVFLREGFMNGVLPPLVGNRRVLEELCAERQRGSATAISRRDTLRIAKTIWRDAGAVKPDAIRISFMRTMKRIGHPDATCPKSWRHSFATLLQDANVDPLVRQITLGHRPTESNGLGMTAKYTHTRPATQRQQIELALRQWPESLRFSLEVTKGGVA